MKLRYYALLVSLLACLHIAAEPTTPAPAENKDSTAETPASEKDPTPINKPSEPKPLSPVAKKGIEWLIKSQREDGGWGQGGGWRVDTSTGGGRVEGENISDPSDIANTAIVLQCLLRSGVKLDSGEHSKVAARAADYLMKEISKADDDTLYVTAVRDTQIQSKIGLYVDTFLAAQILSDLKGKMPNSESEKKRGELLDRVVAKIQKHQKEDGAFDGNNGWAATLSQGLCSRALNSAWGVGANVDIEALKKDHVQNATGLDRKTGVVASGEVGDAGVDIYRYASKIGGMTQFSANNSGRRDELEKILKSPSSTAEAKEQSQKELAEIQVADKDKDVLLGQVAAQVKNESFVAGFGNNGGEEFLSFMNIGEALHAKGGDDWIAWEKQMAESIAKAQNEDGSWAGHHCITGRTFCTATALMVLMSDRAPIQAPAPLAKNTEKSVTPAK